jgi:hypothetical protein
MRCFISKNLLLLIASIFIFGCNRTSTNQTPKLILWAWERPENFLFINPKEIGVAFLAQTIQIKNNEVTKILRHQPLEIPDGTFIIAVTRIESDKREKPTLSGEQRKEIVESISKTASLKNVKAVQIDFDALESEREFYKTLLIDLRKQLPMTIKLSITALASWCIHDNWIKDAPIDEAVPMLFRMGVDEQKIVSYLNSNNDWREPLCRQSYGITLDEPARKVEATRRLYVFNPRSWTKEDLEKIKNYYF